MSLTLNTNVDSLRAQRNTAFGAGALATSMQRLASGLRVNSAADDAAGLAVGARFDAQVRGMNVAVRNLNDGISMLQTADSALSTIGDLFQRMRELAVQSLNVGSGGDGSIDQTNLDLEYSQLSQEIARISAATTFQGAAIIGSGAGTRLFQAGANPIDTISVVMNDIMPALRAGFNTTKFAARPFGAILGVGSTTVAMVGLDAAIDAVNTDRATYGAYLNTFSRAVANLESGVQGQSAARSRTMDADFATETAAFSRASILQRAGDAMVAQANRRPRQVMALLRN